MASLHSIFQDIALMIGSSADNRILEEKIRNNEFDWEKIVPVASSHLIIPLIYYRLKDKNVLDLLPKDLRSYLTEIARQNTERNSTILQEIQDLSLLLRSENIDHVFLKGAALLVSDVYTNLGERMIGDIDILVHPDQLFKAQDLLIKNNYNAVEMTFGHNFVEHKHLARLIPNEKLAAVEIHRKLLHKPVTNQLEPLKVLKNKKLINNISIPDHTDLLNHTVLNFEINDYGYYYNYLGLRPVYDTLKHYTKISNEDFKSINKNKYFSSFMDKVLVYFPDSLLCRARNNNRLLSKLFILKQKNRLVRKFFFRFWNIWQFANIILNRFYMFLGNTAYRKAALNDRIRIKNLITSKIRNTR